MDRQDFLRFVKSQGCKELRTIKRKKLFTVRVTNTGVEYTPLSTMTPRPHQAKYMNRVLDYFEETGSFNTHDYQKFTVCSSYTLALVRSYLAQKI